MRTLTWLKTFLLGVMLTLATPVLAATVSGTVYDDGDPVAGADVYLHLPGATTPTAQAVTDAGGHYTLAAVAAGLYDLTVSPPSTSGRATAHVYGLSITSGTYTQDVVLQGGTPVSTLQGVVRDGSGNPLPGVRVDFYAASATASGGSVTTDATGAYSLVLADGSYEASLSLQGEQRDGGGNLLGQYAVSISPVTTVALSTDATLDLVLPVATISGRTTDALGTPVAGVTVRTARDSWDEFSGGAFHHHFSSGSVVSDAAGNYSLVVLAGLPSLTLTPPAASALAPTLVSGLTISGATTLDLALADRGAVRTVSGVVRDGSGLPLAGVTVDFLSAVYGSETASRTTDANGAYALALVDAAYSVRVSFHEEQRDGSGNLLSTQTAVLSPAVPDFVLDSDLALDLVFPLVTVSGRTTDAAGATVAGVNVATLGDSWTDLATGDYRHFYSSGSVISDAAGHYALRILAGLPSLALTPATDGAVVRTFIGGLDITTDTTRDLVLAARATGHTVTGIVRDPYGQPVANARVDFFARSYGSGGAAVIANEWGAYTVSLPEGTYGVRVSLYDRFLDATGNDLGFSTLSLSPAADDLVVGGDGVLDLVFPIGTMDGKATDSNGIPVAGVSFSSTSESWEDNSTGTPRYFYAAASLVSDADGAYALRLLAGTPGIAVRPPAASGFGEQVKILEAGAASYDIVLDHADTQAPAIVAAPRATSVTAGSAVIQWRTDEPATSSVIVNGVPYSVDGLRTAHAVVVSGLSAASAYTASVSSSDAAGLGPATATVAFNTAAVADATAPTILAGPVVTAISSNRATVRWTTDEATETQLYVGTTSPDYLLTKPGLRTEHSYEFASLPSDLEVVIKVAATDTAGNGPTLSPVVRFRTLAQADTTAPVITRGPVIEDVGDHGATIVWETDEPAVSGVSINDGNVWQVVRDDALVTRHAVRVTGLSPATAYSYAVSSTDAHGNGPATGPSLTFTTRAAADTQKPVLVTPLRVVGITHRSAVVQWQTDESADSTVEYGLVAGTPDTTVSDAALETRHSVTLTALQPNTEYFLRARSVDAAGNPLVTTVASFRTRAQADLAAPVFTAPPSVVGVTDTTVTIAWETDEPADYRIDYGTYALTQFSRTAAGRALRQSVTLTGLVPGEHYGFAVTVSDLAGNETRHESLATVATADPAAGDAFRVALSALGVGEAHAVLGSFGGFLTDLFADTTAPSFTVAPATVWTTDSMVLLGWTTSELASAQVTYGVQGSGDRRVAGELDASLLHAQLLTNLQAATTYAYEVRLRDIAGNETVRAGTFTTAAAADLLAPVLSSIVVTDISAGMAAVALASSEPAIHEIRYGLTADALTETAYSFSYDSLSSVVLANLVNGSTYHYQVASLDAAGNRTLSTIRSFVAGAAGAIGGGSGALSLLLTQAGATVSQVQAGATDFLVSLAEASLPKAASNYVIRWYVDGVHVPALDNVLDATVPSAMLTAGTHTIRAELTDSTASQLTTLRVSQAVAVLPPPTVITPGLDQFAGVAISITQGGREITRAPEGAADIVVRVTGYNPAPGANHTLRWYLDGVHQPEYDNVLEEVALLNPLPSGAHTLRLEITDHNAAMLTTAVTSKVVAVTRGTPAGAFGGLGLLALASLLLRRRR